MDKVVPHDLDQFDTLELRVRGDGRTYFFNIHPESNSPDDLYQAFIFTRGGPNWEIIRVCSDNLFLKIFMLHSIFKALFFKGCLS